MKFNQRSLQILKNFSSIQQGMIFKPGNKLSVVSEAGTILGRATIDDDIEDGFAIYDMAKFLGALSMFTDPELSVRDGYIEISEGTEKIHYNLAEPSLIKSPPDKEFSFDPDVEFSVTSKEFGRVMKGAAITAATHICVTGDREHIRLEALAVVPGSRNQNTGAAYKIELGTTDKQFNFVFLVDNIKMIDTDYAVTISQQGIAKFTGEGVEYYVAVENSSTFEN